MMGKTVKNFSSIHQASNKPGTNGRRKLLLLQPQQYCGTCCICKHSKATKHCRDHARHYNITAPCSLSLGRWNHVGSSPVSSSALSRLLAAQLLTSTGHMTSLSRQLSTKLALLWATLHNSI